MFLRQASHLLLLNVQLRQMLQHHASFLHAPHPFRAHAQLPLVLHEHCQVLLHLLQGLGASGDGGVNLQCISNMAAKSNSGGGQPFAQILQILH